MDHEITIQLFGDERVLTASRASRHTGAATISGQLVLTSHRLIFLPLKQGGGEASIALHQVTAVKPVNLLLVIPSGLSIGLQDGGEERFVVPDRERWQQLIVMASRGELQAQLAAFKANGGDAERPFVLLPGGAQMGPVDKVVSWPAVAAWIALPFAFVPLIGLLPALFVLVCGVLLLRAELLQDRTVGRVSLSLSSLAILLFGVGIASLVLQGSSPMSPSRGANEASIVTSVIQIAVLVMSIVLHECGHGLAAYWSGDPTALRAGRLKLNPIPHIDFFGSIVLPGILIATGSSFLIGWAKPVPVNPALYRKRKLGNLAVSLAGVSANLLVAMAALSLLTTLGAALHFAFPDMTSQGFWMAGFETRITGVPSAGLFALVADVLKYAVLINLILLAFNLLPIPPLDGSHVLELILPRSLAVQFAKIRRFGFFILIGCIFLGVLDVLFRGVAIVLAILGYLAGTICGLG